MADFARSRLTFLRQFAPMRGGAPSHDTFSRVFAHIRPEQFSDCFVRWTQTIQQISQHQVIALDGKTIRHSFDTATDKAAVHLVSAWGTANGIVLGQVRVDDKSNEITAIPKLLKMLAITGCTITIDAMGTQKQIASQIILAGADYVLAVKGNQPALEADIRTFFERGHRDRFLDADANPIPHDCYTTRDANHGRVETRTCTVSDVLDQVPCASDWRGARSIVEIVSERRVGQKVSIERRYYLSSHAPDAQQLLSCIRSHWRVENCLHWVLDVTFDEDASRSRLGHGPENLSVLRQIALNLCKSNTTRKMSVRRKRNLAAWEPEFLVELLTNKIN